MLAAQQANLPYAVGGSYGCSCNITHSVCVHHVSSFTRQVCQAVCTVSAAAAHTSVPVYAAGLLSTGWYRGWLAMREMQEQPAGGPGNESMR